MAPPIIITSKNSNMTKHCCSTRGHTEILPKPFALLLVTAFLSFHTARVADAASIGSASSPKLPLSSLVAGPGTTTTRIMVATSARRLDEAAVAAADDDAAISNEYFQYDLSQFSLKFDKCQYVKMYDDDVAQDYDTSSPLALKHFAVFRLCPTESCASCDADGVVYGSYAVPVDDYLQYTVENRKRTIENVCKQCDEQQACTDDAAAADAAACDDGAENCNGGGGGLSCSACEAGCYQYQNLEDSGYVDASEFLECQKLEVQQAQAADDGGEQQQQAEGEQDEANGDEEQQAEGDQQGRRVEENADDGQQQLYIGARCSSSGKIVIGLFSDERCWEPMDDLDVETLLGAKLSYHLLNASYAADNDGCQSCLEDKNNENERDAEDADDVNEMCEGVYNAAAKCESETGLDVGFVQMNRAEENYENQVENEFQACTFIKSLIWNSYTETGEINVKAPQDVIVRVVTEKQTIALSLLASVIVATLGVMFYLDRRIRQIEQSQPLLISKGESTVL